MLLSMTLEMWWAAFGWLGSALVVFSLLQTNMLWLRVFNLIGCVLAVIYNAPLAIWPSVGLNAAITVINAIHLYRLRRDRLRAEHLRDQKPNSEAAPRARIYASPDDVLLGVLLAERRDAVERRAEEPLNALLDRASGAVLIFEGDTLCECTLELPEGERLIYVSGERSGSSEFSRA